MTTYLLIKVVLELRTPGGVLSPEQTTETPLHLPLARSPMPHGDLAGVHVPATSLAGSLREHLASLAAPLMGEAPDAQTLRGSVLRFIGTRVEPAGPHLQRSRTTIDRQRGAAGPPTLRTAEFLASGSRITMYLRLDDPDRGREVLDALRTWAPSIGRGRSTGHGRCALVALRHRRIDLGTPEGLRAWLTGGGPQLWSDEDTTAEPVPAQPIDEPVLRLHWRIADGLHIGTGSPTRSADGTGRRAGEADSSGEVSGPRVFTVLTSEDGTPVVPATTWKGVLRSRCEFILRSLDRPACGPDVRKPCGRCLICVAFGCTGSGKEVPSRRGLLTFHDSPVQDATQPVQQVHAPLDRVFGGVTDKLLFTEEVVRSGQVTLDIHATGPVDNEVVTLLTLACHDIHSGLLGVGGSTTRGLGSLRLVGAADELAAQRAAAVRAFASTVARAEEEEPA